MTRRRDINLLPNELRFDGCSLTLGSGTWRVHDTLTPTRIDIEKVEIQNGKSD